MQAFHIIVFVALSAFLNSCIQGGKQEDHPRSSQTFGYTQKEVSDLRHKLMNTKFPQKEGFVKSLLKNDSGVGMLTSVADLIPNDEGILAIYTLTYSLNDDYTLIVHQDHYDKGKSPLKTAVVDSKAEIIRFRR